MMQIIPVIMCGGAGTRLWPASRESMPKQFISLLGGRSTFQETVLRVFDAETFGRPVVVTNSDQRFIVADQLQQIGIEADIILEPERRDSAAAVAVGTAVGLKRGPDSIVLVLAADHAIDRPEQFRQTCREALDAAKSGLIVTLGIVPSEPSSSYGYINPGETIPAGTVRRLKAFVEKPSREKATAYIADGYLWNSGNFLFGAATMKHELQRFEPDVWLAAESSFNAAKVDMDFIRLDAEAFKRSPKISIDYAVMEKTDKGAVIPADFGWTDLGSWDAVWAHGEHDTNGNVLLGGCEVLNVRNSIVQGTDGIFTAVIGLDDVAVITTADAVLVAPRTIADDLKKLHAGMIGKGRTEATEHRRVHRPWGHYESVQRGERHLVKRIVVNPGQRLSLQKHFHRSEHWVVVKGTAEITIGDTVQLLTENESTYIPVGTVHRLANPGQIPLEIIEVQVGPHLSEDDIVRLSDEYNRAA